jgi:Rieske 2Fe-2S family protein
VGYFRNFLRDSHATMSRSGAAIGPLLGQLERFDHGETDILFGPNSHVMAYADHAVLFQFLPHGPLDTELVTLWLVKEDAEVDVEALIELWDITTQQDLRIIEANQAGVASLFYEPGPYMLPERDTSGLVRWYLSSLGDPAPERLRTSR